MLTRARAVVGRVAEVEELARVLSSARAGHGGAVFLTGEAGIGKTRLAAELAARAAGRGVPVLRGRGATIGPSLPYRPLTEALLSLSRDRDRPADAALGPYRAVLGQLVPDWSDGTAAGATLTPVILAEAVLRLTAAAGRDGGCLLLLDDLHDADAETLAVVDYLTDNLAGQPVLLLATLRAAPSDALSVVESAERRGGARVVQLARLDRTDTAGMVASCLGVEVAAVPPPVLAELWHSSEGLPFVVEEVLHGLVSGGALARRGDGWAVTGPVRPTVPASLVRQLAARTEQLGGTGRLVLSAAAVLGRRFAVSVLQRATGVDDRALLSTLRAGVAAQLVAPDEVTPDWYTFRHPLTAEGLLALLPAAEHADLCRRGADAVQALHPDLPGEWCALAATLRDGAGETGPAARLYAEAGRRARAAGAPTSAVTLLERADALLAAAPGADPGADPAARADVLAALVPALGEAGQVARALDWAEPVAGLVRAGLDPARGAALQAQIARVALQGGDVVAAAEQLTAARATLGPAAAPTDTAAVDAVAALVALDTPGPGRHATAAVLARRAVAAAEPVPLPEVAFDGWQALGMVARLRDLDESTICFEHAREVAERYQLPAAHAYALVRLGGNQWLADGDPAGLRLARDETARLGMVVLVYAMDSNLAMHEVLDGRYPAAAGLIEACHPAVRRLKLNGTARHLLATRATLYAHQCRRPEMESTLADFAAVGGAEAPQQLLALGLARAFCALLEEDRERARQDLAAAVAVEQRNPTAYHLSGSHGLAVLLGALAGSVDRAEHRRRTDGPAGQMRWNRQFALLAEAVLLGREGRPAEAAAAATTAGQLAARYGMARHLGVRLVAQAARQDGWGDYEEPLRAAEDYFHRGGAPAVASACRAQLRQLGAPVRQRRTGTDRVPAALRTLGVTLREYEVLELIPRRLTNKGIADRLHISPRTVEKHVASLILKTSQPDRAALTTYASGHVPG
jgi:DNA-binding CsgD family transcriptional regulator